MFVCVTILFVSGFVLCVAILLKIEKQAAVQCLRVGVSAISSQVDAYTLLFRIFWCLKSDALAACVACWMV